MQKKTATNTGARGLPILEEMVEASTWEKTQNLNISCIVPERSGQPYAGSAKQR